VLPPFNYNGFVAKIEFGAKSGQAAVPASGTASVAPASNPRPPKRDDSRADDGDDDGGGDGDDDDAEDDEEDEEVAKGRLMPYFFKL
jgi:hypothetical protein